METPKFRFKYSFLMTHKLQIKSRWGNTAIDLVTSAWRIEKAKNGQEIVCFTFTVKQKTDKHVKSIARDKASVCYDTALPNLLDVYEKNGSPHHINLVVGSGYITKEALIPLSNNSGHNILTVPVLDKLTVWDFTILYIEDCIETRILDALGYYDY